MAQVSSWSCPTLTDGLQRKYQAAVQSPGISQGDSLILPQRRARLAVGGQEFHPEGVVALFFVAEVYWHVLAVLFFVAGMYS
jgi:hypothetical protein